MKKKNRWIWIIAIFVILAISQESSQKKGALDSCEVDRSCCQNTGLNYICFRNDVDPSIPETGGGIDVKDISIPSPSSMRDVTADGLGTKGMEKQAYRGSTIHQYWNIYRSNGIGIGWLKLDGYGNGHLLAPAAGTRSQAAWCTKYEWRPDVIKCFADSSYYDEESQGGPINKYTWMATMRATCSNNAYCNIPIKNKAGSFVENSVTQMSNYVITYQENIVGGYDGFIVEFDAHFNRPTPSSKIKHFKFYIVFNETPSTYNLVQGQEVTAYFSSVLYQPHDITWVFTMDEDLANVPTYLQDPFGTFAALEDEYEDYFSQFKYPASADTNYKKLRYYMGAYNYWYSELSSYFDDSLWGEHKIIPPQREKYTGQWIWDSFFSAWGLVASCKDSAPECYQRPKDWVQIFKENQLPNGMWPREIWEFYVPSTTYQPPGGWPFILWEIYKKDKDSASLCSMYQSMADFHEWLRTTDTDLDNRFTYTGGNAGWDNSPRYDGGSIEALDLQGWMILDAEYLGKIAGVCSPADVVLWETRLNDYKQVSSAFWDGENFYDILTTSHTPTIVNSQKILSPAMFWMPFSGISLTTEQKTSFSNQLNNPATLGISNNIVILPTVSRSHPDYNPMNAWSGAMWPNVNLVAWLGMKRQGMDSEANLIKQYTMKPAETSIIGAESYNGNDGFVYSGGDGWFGIPYVWGDATYMAMMQDWSPDWTGGEIQPPSYSDFLGYKNSFIGGSQTFSSFITYSNAWVSGS